MTTKRQIDIGAVLAAHSEWLVGEPGGARADLRGANLLGSDLREANLREANLREANLREANLRHADLSYANLSGTDLSCTDLSDANLYGANLSHANLYGSDLRHANLYGSDLRHANLYGSDLRHANLWGADLDFSAWPLWCGSIGVITDDRLKIQLIAHVTVLAGDIADPDLAELLGSDLFGRVARKCHHAPEMGLADAAGWTSGVGAEHGRDE